MTTNMKNLSIVFLILLCVSCREAGKKDEVVQTRTSGTAKILVDESFSTIVADQIEVFNSDYEDAHFTIVAGNENKIVPELLKDSMGLIVLSRMLKPEEDKFFRARGIVPKTSRFGIDGIALITHKDNVDSNITYEQVLDIFKGVSADDRKLVFDNAYSSTIRYFKDSTKTNELPKKGVYTLESNNDVIKYVSEHKDFIGVVGVNWVIAENADMSEYIAKVKLMGVRNMKAKNDDDFYKPTQKNLMDGIYPFLRNVYIVNCEGREGLGSGFANWLMSQRGQLIVLRSGLGPHKLMPREFNLKNSK